MHQFRDLLHKEVTNSLECILVVQNGHQKNSNIHLYHQHRFPSSDVWSYGVLLWEMYTLGKQPFDDRTGQETVDFIEGGGRLPRPGGAELEVFSTMLWCWEYKAEDRPTFKELFRIFAENPEYQNLKELLQTQDFHALGM